MSHRILITGSRAWDDKLAIYVTIKQFHRPDSVIVHGHCPTGADALADSLCRDIEWNYERHPAKWDKPCGPECSHMKCSSYNRSPYYACAGHVRNQKMVDLGADICLAFIMPGSRGTWDCLGRAEAAGIPVVKVFGPGMTAREAGY